METHPSSMFQQQQQKTPLQSHRLEETGPLRPVRSEEGLLKSPDQPGSDSCCCGDAAIHPAGQQGAAESYEESRAAEVQAMGSLTVTIQRSSESREFRQTDRSVDRQTDRPADRPTDGLYCYVCNTSCPTQQLFQEHMTGEEHQNRLKQHITLLTTTTHAPLPGRGRRPGVQQWCATCQSHFTGDLILHRRTSQHKVCKQSSRPFCSVCKRHFRTPRKFVEHMKSPEHKQQVHLEEAMEEELITVDAVGCFEGEEEGKEKEAEEQAKKNGEEKEEKEGEEEEGKCAGEEEEEGRCAGEEEENTKLQEDMQPADGEESGRSYDPKTTYGSGFVVPVSGFLCQLCHKFFYCEDTARHTHCRTHTHYLNMQKYTAKTMHRSSTMDNGSSAMDNNRHTNTDTHQHTHTD